MTWTPPPKDHCFCAVMFYFNYTCRVKKINKKYHETKTIIIIYTFTVQLYNISTRSNTLEIIYTAGLASPCCTVFKSKLHDKIRFICTYTELRLKYKGFNLDCNRKTQFILQCTRQLSSVCWVYVCDVSVRVSSRKESPNTGKMTGRKSLHTIITCKQNVALG